MEDKCIIELFWMRNEAAITETANTYGSRLFQLANRILQNREDAEESVNDTYLRAWKTIPPQRPESLFAYLARNCRWIAFDKYDRIHAKKRNAEVVSLSEDLEYCIPDKYREREIEGQEIGRLLSSFLRTLSIENRTIFLERYWYVFHVSEIAERHSLSENNIKMRLYRIREKLRKYLESEGIQI